MRKNVSNKALAHILFDMQAECARKGINAHFEIKTGKNYRGEKYSYIKSTPFAVVPAIVNNAYIEASVYVVYGAIRDDKTKKHLQPVSVDIRVKYDLPDNGSNGHALGRILYDIDYSNGSEGIIADKEVNWYMQ